MSKRHTSGPLTADLVNSDCVTYSFDCSFVVGAAGAGGVGETVKTVLNGVALASRLFSEVKCIKVV